MKIFVIATRSGDPDEIAKLLEPEAKIALQMVADDFVREIYSRKDGRGAVLVVEADSLEGAQERLGKLPLVAAKLLDLEFYPVGAYRAITAMANA
ncbi:MAG TPA: hypothetical protein VM325_01180 [Alphaproteobacteria bacterium]|nr:hypothetical protein [Alphaproteobacteria bacterium]